MFANAERSSTFLTLDWTASQPSRHSVGVRSEQKVADAVWARLIKLLQILSCTKSFLALVEFISEALIFPLIWLLFKVVVTTRRVECTMAPLYNTMQNLQVI